MCRCQSYVTEKKGFRLYYYRMHGGFPSKRRHIKISKEVRGIFFINSINEQKSVH